MASLALKLEYHSESTSCNIDKLKALFDASNISERPTHIVQSVEYGWEAFIVLEKTGQNKTSLMLAQTELEMIGSKLTHSKTFDPEDFDQKVCEGITCKFFSDVEIDTSPSTFFEALETIKLFLEKPLQWTGETASVSEPLLFQGLPRRYLLTNDFPVSRGSVCVNGYYSFYSRGSHNFYVRQNKCSQKLGGHKNMSTRAFWARLTLENHTIKLIHT